MAVNAGAVAIPVVPVMAVVTVDPPKVPPAPLAGAVNVTTTPATGAFAEFITVAVSGVAKAVPTVALCGVPPVALTDIESGAVLVRLNVAPDAPFGTVATTT